MKPAALTTEPGAGLTPGVASPPSYVAAVDTGFEAFYRDNTRRLCAVLTLHAGLLHPDAEDIAQEAFARVLARWPNLDHTANPTGYLYRVAFRVARTRKVRREPAAITEVDAATDDASGLARIAVERAIRTMPRRQRQVALLCLVAELTPNEAAHVLRIRPATARVHLHNARKQLSALELR